MDTINHLSFETQQRIVERVVSEISDDALNKLAKDNIEVILNDIHERLLRINSDGICKEDKFIEEVRYGVDKWLRETVNKTAYARYKKMMEDLGKGAEILDYRRFVAGAFGNNRGPHGLWEKIEKDGIKFGDKVMVVTDETDKKIYEVVGYSADCRLLVSVNGKRLSRRLNPYTVKKVTGETEETDYSK